MRCGHHVEKGEGGREGGIVKGVKGERCRCDLIEQDRRDGGGCKGRRRGDGSETSRGGEGRRKRRR